MSKTAVADIIVPDIFERYIIQRTAEYSVFGASDVIGFEPDLDDRANGGGIMVDMPFWNDLTGDRQLLSDTSDLSVNKIGAAEDIARLHNDANAWSVNLLAKLLSGEDPMGAIGDLLGAYWARQDAAILIASLQGVLAALDVESGDPNLLNIQSETAAGVSDATQLNGSTFIDALQKLGDRNDRLVAIAMHSVTESALKKLDLIDFIPDSEGKPTIKVFQGRMVIVDDSMPSRVGTTDGTVYTSVLFGPGAFGKGSANLAGMPLKGGFGTEAVEFARVALASDDVLINRRRHILHPRGVKWLNASVAGRSPTNAELALAANWQRVYESKNVRIVGIRHNN